MKINVIDERGQELMTQLPTWLQQMQTEAKSLVASLKLPQADRTNIKNWEFEAIESQTPSTYKNEIPSLKENRIKDKTNFGAIFDAMLQDASDDVIDEWGRTMNTMNNRK